MNQLNILERRHENVIILDLTGNIRIGDDILIFRKTLRRIVEEGGRQILLNLANVSYIDSSGLGEMVSGFVSLKKNNGELKLLNLTDRISELMMITKLLTVFDAYENENDAVNSFQYVSENNLSGQSAQVTVNLDRNVINQ